MNKPDLLRNIAQKGYDILFGAKKSFATYDIVIKTPNWISFCSLAFGILALVIKCFSTEIMSAVFIILGVVALYINLYSEDVQQYSGKGDSLIKLHNKLKELYFDVKGSSVTDMSEFQAELDKIDSEYYDISINKQILFSNWYAHYKFFWESQTDWINKELKLNFFRDKIPLSVWSLLFIFILIILTGCLFC